MIRKAAREDLDRIEQIETTVFQSDQLSRASLRRYLSAPSAAMIVATDEGTIAGYALVGFRKGSKIGRLYSIAVDAACARRGVGRALLEGSEELARQRQCDRFALEVRADNPRAIALYEKNGYDKVGVEKNWYEDGGSAYRFEKKLTPR